MIAVEQTVPEKAAQFQRLLRACGRSIVMVSLAWGIWGLLQAGLVAGLVSYFFAVVIAAFAMCPVLLVCLAIIFASDRELHPLVFSLVGVVVLGIMAYKSSIMVMNGYYPSFSAGQALFILVSMLYGAPIGFYLRTMQPTSVMPASA